MNIDKQFQQSIVIKFYKDLFYYQLGSTSLSMLFYSLLHPLECYSL